MTLDPELGERERAALDVWEPMEPSDGFADRVLAVRGARRWLPYLATAIACGAAAAIIAALLSKPGEALPDAANVAFAPADAHEIDVVAPPLMPDAETMLWDEHPYFDDAGIPGLADAGGYYVDGSYFPSPLSDTTNYDVEIDAGETVTIHTPTDAAYVKFRDASCNRGSLSSGVAVEINSDPTFKSPASLKHSSLGTTGAIVEAAVGVWHYRVNCAVTGTPVVLGKVIVLRDDGTGRTLPSQATTITVEPDGKIWRVEYASKIPTVIVKRPPGGERFHLVDGKGVDRTTFIKDPTATTLTIDGATLTDQSYVYWFERGGIRVGLSSTLRVERDLTPQQISIEAPALDAVAKAPIDVRGTALEGWTITVDRTVIPVDAQHHFATTAGVDANHVVAIRASHPRWGIHYFIRRLRTP